jgi:regulator of nucleoside diphosphate kinase
MHALPEVTITSTDRQRLVPIATAALASERGGLCPSMLLGEIARATVVQADSLPPNVVDMGSAVEVRDNIRETTDVLRIVYPGEEDSSGHKILVLTPLGAAHRVVGRRLDRLVHFCKGQEKPHGTPGPPPNSR